MVVDELVISSYLAVYARWIIGIVLLVAGAAKAQDMREFVVTVQAFRIVPRQISKGIASLIVALELVLGSSLLVGIGVRFTTIAAVLLFGSFTVVILVNLVRDNYLDCKCFGPYFKEKISGKVVIRNLGFMTLCLWVWQFYDGYLTLESWLFGNTGLQNRPLEQFILLTGTIIVFGISILSARTVFRNFTSATSNKVN